MTSEKQGGVSRLVSHRNAFLGSKVPMTGPLLRYADLNGAEQSLIRSDFIGRGSGPIDPGLYLEVMHSWGVMCPHPRELRLYEGLYRSVKPMGFDESPWFACGICECIVINR